LSNYCKVNSGVLRLWAQVLAEVPGSRLLIMCEPGSQRDVAMRQLEPIDSSRIEFVTKRPRPDYLKLYHRIDLGLDTFPYTGHTTSLDAFWMGVPVVSVVGRTAVSRGGLSLARNLDLKDLAVESDQAYVATAVGLANDLPRLAQLRAGLRSRMQNSALMDARQFARDMEQNYRALWRTWCQKHSAPQH
jgi:protein O-GlcNAc transferase